MLFNKGVLKLTSARRTVAPRQRMVPGVAERERYPMFSSWMGIDDHSGVGVEEILLRQRSIRGRCLGKCRCRLWVN